MRTTRPVRKTHRFAMFHAYFLLVFLVLLPKGGIKAGGAPLTWGYFYLALSAPFLLLVRLLATPLRMRGTALGAVAMTVPMQIILGYAFFTYGHGNAGYAISMVIGMAVLPWLFLLVYPAFFRTVDPDRLSKCFRFCMLAAALWGIFLFFLHPITGHYIEIPYLTVNAADYGLLETKFNNRGFYLKLISTYNNGNLYGVATLILLPLYNAMEPARWKRGVLLTALLLTLSRTVWVGLIVMEGLPLLVVLAKQVRTFPVLYLGPATRRILTLGVMVGLVFIVLLFTTNSGIRFLLDPTLGGRTEGLPSLSELPFLPTGPLLGFDESLYTSAARYYGWTGLFSFTLVMASPLLLLALDRSALRSPDRMAAFRGLLLYSVVAFSDGAFVLIPVTVFYWFAYAVFTHGWPGRQAHALPVAARTERTLRKPSLLLEPG